MRNRTKQGELLLEIESLRRRLGEAEETLSAIRRGAVDAILVSTPSGDRVYALKGAEHPYRVFFEAMNEGAVTISRDGDILYANGRFSVMTGRPLKRILGSSFLSFIEEKERGPISARFKASRRGAQVFETTLRTSGVGKLPVSISLSELKIEEVPYLCLVITDITERLRNEEELKAMNESLEKKVSERTSELNKYAAELEASYRDLQSFSYSASHDLKSPLRIIEGFSKILIEDYSEKLDDEGRKLLNGIVKYAVKMSDLIDDILSFSRVSSTGVSTSVIDMNQLVSDVVDELKAQGGELEIRLAADDLPRCHGDRAMISLVLSNLLSNALKFSLPKKNPHIRIGGRVKAGQNEYYVRDNGVGFDMKYSSKLFSLFQRLHPQFEGTGVGLAIVKRIVEKHGGTVRAEGKPGKGATFYFSLPCSSSGQVANRKK